MFDLRMEGSAMPSDDHPGKRDRASRLGNRHAAAQRLAGVGTWEWDVRSDEVYWSEAIEPLFGYAPGEFDGSLQGVASRIYPDDLDRWQESLRGCLEEGIEHRIEFRCVWPDGTIRWVAAFGNAGLLT